MAIHRPRHVFALLSVLLLALLGAACQAAPAQSAPQAQAGPGATKLFLAADMVQGSKNLSETMRAARSCVLTSRFAKNSEMVWRVRVSDPVSGELQGKDELSKVEIRLANGTNVEMQYGPHPKDPPGESYWTGSWVVPKEAPSGTLEYTIVATDPKGRTGEWKPFSVRSSLPIITDEVLPDVPAKA